MKHYNPTIAEDATRIFNLKNGDMIPEDIGDPVAVIPISRYCNIVRNGGSSATGTISVYTAPADKDFYVTAVLVSFTKDAACDSATGSYSVQTTIEGVTRNLAQVDILTLTAQSQTVFCPYPLPIKIDRGAGITFTGAFTAGACRRGIVIYGYTVETTKGV